MKKSSSMVSRIGPSGQDVSNIWMRVNPAYGVSMMDLLYNKLGGMYPGRWFACFKDEVSIQSWRESWAEAFEEEGLTPHHIRPGLAQCRKLYDWPPSLTEFIKACKGAVIPAMHRPFPKELVQRETPESRRANLAALMAESKKLFNKMKIE